MDADLKNTLTLGIKCFQNKEYDRAEEILLDVLKKKDNMADVHNMLGLIYHDQGKFTKASKSFTKALELNPNYTEASLNLAVVSSDIGMHSEAKQTLEKIAARQAKKKKGEMDPYLRGKIANMHAEIGDIYKSIGRITEAKSEYESALKLCPDFVDIWVKMANTLRDGKEYEEAIKTYNKAKSYGKAYPPIGINLGITYYSMGQKEKALAQWNKVLQKDPNNTMAKAYIKLVK